MLHGIPVVLGTAAFGTSIPTEESWRVLDKYASLGGRVVDTANMYAFWHPRGKGGESERVIGSWLARRGRRAFTIMTKIGSRPIDAHKDRNKVEGLSPGAVRSAVKKSLTRLKTDYIDILLAHHDDRNTPLLDTWKCFSDLVAEGKVKKIGVSNYSPARMAELARIVLKHDLAPIDFVQLQYSVIDPVGVHDWGNLVLLTRAMRSTLRRLVPGAVIFAYSPLLGGRVFEKTAQDEWPAEYDSLRNRSKVRTIQRKAGELNVTPSACVLKQIADQGIWPITATGNVARLETNLKLFNVKGARMMPATRLRHSHFSEEAARIG